MSYEVVLSEISDRVIRAIGENVFFEDLEFHYKLNLFYYYGAMPNEDLESKLRDFGDKTRKNLFVNIGRLGDPRGATIKDKVEIRNLPVIVIPGIDGLVSFNDKDHFSTAYVRIDDKDIINSLNFTIECIERMFNLFIGGQISVVSYLKNKVIGSLKGIGKFLCEKNINLEGKFQINSMGSAHR